VNSCFLLMKQRKIFEIPIKVNRFKFVINNESSKNTDVKPDINQLSTNKRCQFLENIVIRGEISEQNPNLYCTFCI
jgi:cell division protein FtsL